MLTLRQFSAPFRCLLSGHAQENHAGIFITVLRHVCPFIARLVRMLRITRSETAIAFLQPRNCLSRRNDRLIRMRGISGSGKAVSAKQTDHDEATDDLRLFHAGIYERIALFVQSESQNGTNQLQVYTPNETELSHRWRERALLSLHPP